MHRMNRYTRSCACGEDQDKSRVCPRHTLFAIMQRLYLRHGAVLASTTVHDTEPCFITAIWHFFLPFLPFPLVCLLKTLTVYLLEERPLGFGTSSLSVSLFLDYFD